jgi:hypothetical protein
MILVTDLRKITRCPNCGNSDLDCWYNINTQKHSKYCAQCEEEMFEKEQDLCLVGVDLANEPLCSNDADIGAFSTIYAPAAERLRELGQETDMLVIREMCDIIATVYEKQHNEAISRMQ